MIDHKIVGDVYILPNLFRFTDGMLKYSKCDIVWHCVSFLHNVSSQKPNITLL